MKDAAAVRNVAEIVSNHANDKLGIVVSAMGKTTNAMEDIVKALCDRDKDTFIRKIEERRAYHLAIMDELFDDQSLSVYTEINGEFDTLITLFEDPIPENFDFEYDQIVSRGEIISTKIISEYLHVSGIRALWADARKLIRTDNKYREGEVDWQRTEELFKERFLCSVCKDIKICFK